MLRLEAEVSGEKASLSDSQGLLILFKATHFLNGREIQYPYHK